MSGKDLTTVDELRLRSFRSLQPRSGGKSNLLGISKRGDTYLRTLLIHGGRAMVQWAARKGDPQNRINQLVHRRN